MFNTARMACFAALLRGRGRAGIRRRSRGAAGGREAPPPVVYEQPADVGGWYIRGDIDYHWSDFGGADYTTYSLRPRPASPASFATGELKGAFSLGAGVGYQVNEYFRTDLTGDYWFKSDFRGSTNGFCGVGSSLYVDRHLVLFGACCCWPTPMSISAPGTASRPMSAPVSAAPASSGTRCTTPIPTATSNTTAASNWRFAYALMAGASYCLTDQVKLDVGYRFTPHRWRPDVRIRIGQQCRPGLRSTASTCTKCAAACATSSAGQRLRSAAGGLYPSPSRSTPSNRFEFQTSRTARPCRAVFVCAACPCICQAGKRSAE